MRPLKLEMSAFGSYGGLEVVDFSGMSREIFLITGDTGAGKTTIFDGMMYALYDETSGGKRDGSMMRSQYAALDAETFVRLTFLYRGEVYQIRRNPEYKRPGKRKSASGERKLVKEAANVELILPDGKVFPGKKRETDEKIVEIIGLDASQFRQVAMLSQGDFLKLLHAESKERKEIFSKIFHTKLYRQMQERLYEKAQELKEVLREKEEAAFHEIRTVKYQPQSSLASRWEQQKTSGSLFLEEVLGLLEEISAEDRQEMERIEGERAACRKRRESLEETERIRQKAKQAGQRLTEQRQQVKTREELLLQTEERAKQVEEELLQEKAVLSEQEPKLSETMVRLRDGLAKSERLQQKKRMLETKEKEKQELEGQKKKNQDVRQEIQEKEEKNQDFLDKVKDLAADQVREEARLEDLRQKKDRLLTYREQLEDLKKQAACVEKARASFGKAHEKAKICEKAYEQKYQLFFREQAGILAAGLQEGEACPVCGSKEHPHKAQADCKAPSQKEVEEAREHRDKAEKERQKAQNRFISEKQKLQTQAEHLNKQGRELFEREDFQILSEETLQFDEQIWEDVDKKCGNVDKMLTKTAENVDKIRKLEKQKQICQKNLEVLKGNLEKLKEREEQLEEQLRETIIACEKLTGEIHIFAEEIRFLDTQEAQKQLQECEKALEDQRRRVEKKQIEKDAVSRKLHRMRGENEAQKEQISESEKEEKAAKEAYENSCRLLGIEGEETLSLFIEEEKAKDRLFEEQYRNLFHQVQTNSQAKNNLHKIWKEQGKLQKQYLLYSDLSRTANGTLQGTKKVGFETYVQRQYFRQIIHSANKRLARMNHQQFILQCREMEHLGTQGQAGLELDVYHFLNQSVRDVKTLSGGESFMAALAMALGLADVIQNEAGAIRLDTMFVDEGFGSLDDEARKQAVSVLLELSGDRLVGIISHVNELKEQIENKILVSKDSRGSHISVEFSRNEIAGTGGISV